MTGDLLLKMALLDSCAVSDALDGLGHCGVALGLSQLSTKRRITGRVVTVALEEEDGRPSGRHLGTAAVEEAGPNDVIVVDHRGRIDVAGWGGLLSLGAKLRGAEGIVIDGALRDVDEARALDLPVFARAGVPRTARGRIIESGWNVPVTICGVAVSPGDYVIADGSGVVFVPGAHAVEIVATAERIMAKEALMAEAVRSGDPISKVMGHSYEAMIGRPAV